MIACVFPGQGSQYTGMGSELHRTFPEARAVFEEADEVLDFPLSRLCFEGPDDQLQLTTNTQPAILTTAVAAFRVLQARGVVPGWVAGHSLGEYSALVAAGSLRFSDAVRLVRQRGRFMQEAVPVGEGAMAAVLGLDLQAVKALCEEAARGEVVEPANINSPTQIVIAGHRAAVERVVGLAPARGARRSLMLPVSAPFHCRLMDPAARRLAPLLQETDFADLSCPLINNAAVRRIDRGTEAREGLLQQVASPVRWSESVEKLVASGVTRFYEVGPGKVLTGLIRKIAGELPVTPIETPEQLEALCSS